MCLIRKKKKIILLFLKKMNKLDKILVIGWEVITIQCKGDWVGFYIGKKWGIYKIFNFQSEENLGGRLPW